MQARRAAIVALNVVVFWLAIPALLWLAGRQVDGALHWRLAPDSLRWLGGAAALAGGGLAAWSMLVLMRRGRGLPISALPPDTLVNDGPYRHLRHPIYTGFAFLAGGAALAAGSRGTAFAVLPAAGLVWFLTWVKLYEEPGLHRRFGAAFRARRAHTAMFLPLPVGAPVRALTKAMVRLFVKVRVEGRENLPARGPYILASNHLSYTDLVFGQMVGGRSPLVPASAEVFRKPLAAAVLGLLHAVPKRRFTSDPAVALALADELRVGGVVGIAVEGERSWTGELGPLAPGVARALERFQVPVVPVGSGGSYRFWPRWAKGFDRSVPIVLRVGPAFDPARETASLPAGSRERHEAIARLVRERLQAVIDASELQADPARHKGARPELALWRCPVCAAEETLSWRPERGLVCGACAARWAATGGGLTLEEPATRRGEHDTIAGWARRAGTGFDFEKRPEPWLVAADAEWREDEDAATTLLPLQVIGRGEARLLRDRIEWRSAAAARTVSLEAVRSVTTERNDTLQLGTGRGVVQLVFERSSPLRWQLALLQLLRRGEAE